MNIFNFQLLHCINVEIRRMNTKGEGGFPFEQFGMIGTQWQNLDIERSIVNQLKTLDLDFWLYNELPLFIFMWEVRMAQRIIIF